MIRFLKSLGHDDRGATAIEYGLIVALIFIAILSSVGGFADTTNAMWNMISSAMANATV